MYDMSGPHVGKEVISQEQVISLQFNITAVSYSKILKINSAHTKSIDLVLINVLQQNIYLVTQ